MMTLMSSGNSSRLVLRRNFPKLVSRWSSGSRLPSLSRSFVIVWNLYMKNGVPFRPGRFWRKKTGAPCLISTSRVKASKTGQISRHPPPVATRSNSRFICQRCFHQWLYLTISFFRLEINLKYFSQSISLKSAIPILTQGRN